MSGFAPSELRQGIGNIPRLRPLAYLLARERRCSEQVDLTLEPGNPPEAAAAFTKGSQRGRKVITGTQRLEILWWLQLNLIVESGVSELSTSEEPGILPQGAVLLRSMFLPSFWRTGTLRFAHE